MATIVNNPGTGDSGSAGWVVAVVILVALVLIALFVWPGFAGNMGAPTADTTNVEVNIPNPVEGVGGDRGGDMGGEEMPQ